MPTKYPTLDGISSFVKSGTSVTATVSYSFYHAPAYVYYVNTYVVGERLYISGAEHPANNGFYTITGFTGNTVGSPTGTITYTNASGVTAANQFALCSPAPILVKPVTGDITTYVAQPFSYLYQASTGWNPLPSYAASTYPSIGFPGTGTGTVTNTGTTHVTTTVTGSFSQMNVTYSGYVADDITAYGFNPSFKLPVLPGTLSDSRVSFVVGQNFTIGNASVEVSGYGGLAYDGSTYLYFADTTANVIRRITVSTGAMTTIAGNGSSVDIDGNGLSAAFMAPKGIYYHLISGVYPHLCITSYGSGSIRLLNLATGAVTTLATGQFTHPTGIVYDSVRNLYYVACEFACVYVWNPNTNESYYIVGTETCPSQVGLAINSACSLLYLTGSNNIIYSVTLADGSTNFLAGSANTGTSDGTGAAATFNAPSGIALDEANGCLYVVDYGGNKVRKITTSGGVVTTIAGSGSATDADGLGTAASFKAPFSIILGSTNTLYVSDSVAGPSWGIRKINISGSPASVTSGVFSGTLAGYNAITIEGTIYQYNTPPTLSLITGPSSYIIRFTGSDGIPHDSISYPNNGSSVTPFLRYQTVPNMTSLSFEFYGPYMVTGHTGSETPVVRVVTANTSSELIPLISPGLGPTDPSLTFSSAIGFTYVPATRPLVYQLTMTSDYTGVLFDTYTNNVYVNPVNIIVTPTLTSPLQLYTYMPFSYVFTIPTEVVDVTLDTSTTDPLVKPYLTTSEDATSVTFASTKPLDTFNARLLKVRAYLYNVPDVQASNETTVTISPTTIVVTPTILSGITLNLYKYEPFSYVFSILGTASTLTLRYTRSSSQLSVYSTLSSDGRTFTFAGTPSASYTSTFSLVVDLMNGTTVVSTTTYPVTISAGRIKFLPASPYALNQYENISNTFGSNIAWESSNAPDSIVSVPTLPYGLSFSSTAITGIPQTQQAQRNYQIIGSNTTNGSISTANIAISVGVPVVRISPASASFAGLGIGSTPTATFTSLVPQTIYSSSFVYMWSPSLPDGLVFTDIGGNTLPNLPYYPPTSDTARTITLAGSPTMTDAAGFPSSGLVTVTLSGIYKDATNVQTTGTSTLALQFAEAVLMSSNVSTSLYVGKPLGSNDVTFTAASYFPSTSPIIYFSISALPAGLSLRSDVTNKWYLEGTPTKAGTTSAVATATNSHAITGFTPSFDIVINPDVVTFTLTPPSPTFVVSRILPPGAFQVGAVATSGAAITYTSSVNLALYGLSLGSVSGIVSGTPTGAFSGTVIFTATDALGASNTYTVVFTISEDTFAWPGYAPTYFQNRAVTPYQLIVTTTSGRAIQSFSSTNMPTGLTLSPSGLITGTPTVSTGGTFTVTATTGYQAPSNASYSFTYTVIADNLLVVQVNGVDPISTTFSNIQFVTLQYSSATTVTPVYSVLNVTPIPAPALTMSPSGMLSGDFTGVNQSLTYTADIQAVYAGITGTTAITMKNGTLFTASGPLTFTQPTQSAFTLYQYVPYDITVQATGASGFKYYYATGVPVGFQFTPESTGTTASITGISPSNGNAAVTLYAKTASSAASATRVQINTVIPFFVNPQSGAGAYTAIVREHVDADAAQNARDNRTFPQVDSLAGPFMAPRAPDVVTQSNCFLGLCKKPCPTCRTMM